MVETNISDNIKNIVIPSSVILVVVSKTRTISEIIEAYNCGIRNFGENYVLEGIEKIKNISTSLTNLSQQNNIIWHFIGHIQSNKLNLIATNFDFVQSLSSEKHSKILNDECVKLNKLMPVLIEVNIGEEDNKSGVKLDFLLPLIKFIKSNCNSLKLRGFMCIPPINNSNIYFKKMNELFNKYKFEFNLDVLSMGMSSDYIEAINSGSNMIRVGTKIFGERIYDN